MRVVDLIVKTSGQLLTCASLDGPKRGAAMLELSIIDGGAVAVSDGRIVGVGKAEDIGSSFSAELVLDAEGSAICPGFVDPHTHVVFAGDRLGEFEAKIKGADYLEILRSGGGILSTVRHTRAASMTDLVAAGIGRLNQMVDAGTTTAEVKTGYGLDLETELKMLEAIAELDRTHPVDLIPTFLAAHAIPAESSDDPGKYVDQICSEMLTAAWQWYERSRFFGDRPFFADVFTEQGAFDVEQSRRVLERAKALGFSLKAHADEFSNLGGSRLAIGLGAVSIDHLDAISDAEIQLLSDAKTVGIVTPTVNFNLGGSDFADARRMIDDGCAIAISTDYNPGSAPCPSQQMAMAIACRYQKLLPAEALNAATINAAFACGVGHDTGSIEVGKKADILVLNSPDYRQIAFEFGANNVRTVVKKGRIVPSISGRNSQALWSCL